jgi:hypothetical protein
MDLDDQFRRFFGTSDLAALTPATLAGGIEQMQVEFGLETDAGRRFGLWTILHMLNAAPGLDVAFKNASERDAARNFMDMLDRTTAIEAGS